MTRPQQIGLVTEVIRVMEDRQVTVMEVREIADVCAALLVSAFVGGFAGMMARSFAREALGLENKKKIRPALDLVLPATSTTPQQTDSKELFEAREFHRLTRNEMLRLAREATLREGFAWDKASEERTARLHKQTVETAVREGVPVPEAVLKDYPALRPLQAQSKDIDILDRLIRDKQRDLWPPPSLSDARKAAYKDILNGFGTVHEAKDYVEGMPEDSVLFTARGDEISFTLIKLIITDIERNPWLSPFKPERRPDISWQPPLMPKTETYYTISFQGDTTFKTGEIVSEQAFRAENERVTKLGLRPARGWVASKGELLSWGNGWKPVKELEEYLPASIPRDDLTRIADKYGWWAAKLAQSVCPHSDVACVEREARRLVEARRARLE